MAATVKYGLTKMQYKQRTRDPSSFKHFLQHENIKPGTIIRYVGNRFNVLLYFAVNLFQIILLFAKHVLLQKQLEV